MNEFKGTPGPWVLDGVEIRSAADHPADSPICVMAPGFSRDDAALIAAAPELLAALEALLDYAESGWDHFPEVAFNARAAIAGALGK